MLGERTQFYGPGRVIISGLCPFGNRYKVVLFFSLLIGFFIFLTLPHEETYPASRDPSDTFPPGFGFPVVHIYWSPFVTSNSFRQE